jgi:diguanylate cyclase (GGDEF)-like protein
MPGSPPPLLCDTPDPPAAGARRFAGVFVRALRVLITRVPDRIAVRVVTAVCVTLSMFGYLLYGALSSTEIGPHLQQIITVGIAVPVIVVMPFASVAIQLVRELEAERTRAVELASIDSLTGLFNRGRLVEVLERDLALARRMRRHLMVAVLDVDDFKSVNDGHGHITGDALLRAVSATCMRCVRTTDFVGRWGGEEFVLILPDTDTEGGAVLLERMRRAISATVVHDGGGQPVSRTVSIGAVALSPTESKHSDLTVPELLANTDRAMYRAKVQGKDRVVMEVLAATARASNDSVVTPPPRSSLDRHISGYAGRSAGLAEPAPPIRAAAATRQGRSRE